jgi:hypothetical protein
MEFAQDGNCHTEHFSSRLLLPHPELPGLPGNFLDNALVSMEVTGLPSLGG